MKRMNPHGSRRQLQGCFRITYGGPLQSIPSGDLVVVALEHPTPWRPNALAIQRPRDPTPWRPNALHQAKSPPWGDPAVRPEEQKFKPATRISLRAKHPLSPRGDPAFRVEQEMKGRRPKRPPFNQIRYYVTGERRVRGGSLWYSTSSIQETRGF